MAWSNLQKMYYRNANIKYKIVELRKEGLTIRQIADVTKMSKSAVHRLLKNVEKRPNYFSIVGI